MKNLSAPKSFDEWRDEICKYAYLYYDKYSFALANYDIPKGHAEFYCRIAGKYYDLLSVLNHIKKYNDIVSDKCGECAENEYHRHVIKTTYEKYVSFIKYRLNIVSKNN